MPRGKNYVNNNRGVTLQSSSKKKASLMQECFYGAGCTRADCIYRHPPRNNNISTASHTKVSRSTEPCMAFLAGLCTFSAEGCRKRHPDKLEKERLVAKYKKIPCRYGDGCKTKGCLYIHPGDEQETNTSNAGFSAVRPVGAASGMSFPHLTAGRAAFPGSSWKADPMPGTLATPGMGRAVNQTTFYPSARAAPVYPPHSQRPFGYPPSQQTNPSYPYYEEINENYAESMDVNAGDTYPPPSASGLTGHESGVVTSSSMQSETQPSLRVSAREFVPGRQ